LTWTAVKI